LVDILLKVNALHMHISFGQSAKPIPINDEGSKIKITMPSSTSLLVIGIRLFLFWKQNVLIMIAAARAVFSCTELMQFF
jgi:hypothetical protein